MVVNQEHYSIDEIDQKILSLLQDDSTISIGQIAERVGLSQTPCWRRIRRLEQAGVIRARVALLNADQINLGVTVFVTLKTRQHNAAWLARMAEAVLSIDEVVEFYRMSGDSDYLLKVLVPDIAAYDEVYKRLIDAVELYDVSSSFAMEEIKYTTALPLRYAR
jgi:Lrp/AsnC family transcriptional regulator